MLKGQSDTDKLEASQKSAKQKNHSVTSNGIDIPDLGQPIRNRALKTLFQLLSQEDNKQRLKTEFDGQVMTDKQILDLSIEIEEKMYTKDLDTDYSQFVRDRILLLQDKNSSDLRLSLIAQRLSAEEFVQKKHDDLLSDSIRDTLNAGIEWKMKA